MANEKYVALLDVLGFSDLIANNSPEIIEKIYSESIKESLNIVFWKEIDNVPDQEDIQFLIISDSIFIWTNDVKMESFITIVSVISFLLSVALSYGIPLRGAICKGPVVIVNHNNSTNIIGTPITQAFQLEKKQQWSGCLVQKEIIEESGYFDLERNTYLDLVDNHIIKYEAPLKDGDIREEYVINWVSDVNAHQYTNYDFIEWKFSEHNKRINNWDVRQKMRNTVEFAEYIVKQGHLITGPDE